MFIQKIKEYASLVKFSHSLFAMPFALIGFFTAALNEGFGFRWDLLIWVVACMVFARNSAMSFNRYIDREFDGANPRTLLREIPAGIIKARSAFIFSAVNAALFMASAWCINPLCFKLSPIALLVITGYSLTKRFTSLSHLVLGAGLALAPLGAYIAVSGAFALLPVLFAATVLFWVSGFDIIYALQDEVFDKDSNLHSLPVRLGKKNSLHLSRFFHTLSLAFLAWAGLEGAFGPLYWIGATLFALLILYQHTLVKPHDLSKVNLAFATTNGIASLLLAIFVVLDLMCS